MLSTKLRWLMALLVASLLVACGSDDDNSGASSDDVNGGQDEDVAGDDTTGDDVGDDVEEDLGPNPDCDPLDPHYCQFPWPSNLYLEADESRETGYTLRFGETSLPTNKRGDNIAPEDYARLDGYGPGTYALTYFHNLDGERFGEPGRSFPTEFESMGDSMLDDAPILWFEVSDDGLERIPFFAELDHRQRKAEERVLIVRPGVILKENTRYILAFRDLYDRDGDPIQPSEAFAALRDGTAADDELLAPRVERFESMFDELEDAGIARDSLILAWDFNVASSDGLHGPILHMRDDALERTDQLGARIEIDWDTLDYRESSEDGNSYRVTGTYTVPNYMVAERVSSQGAGFRLNFDDDWLPQVNPDEPEYSAEVFFLIPESVIIDAEAEVDPDDEPVSAGMVMYGHGLNGRGTQVYGGFNTRMANDYNLIFYGIDMAGMSEEDVPGIIYVVGQFSYFRWLADRMHQGLLNHVLLARGMKETFADVMADEAAELLVNIDPERFYYSGISQGGIYGQSVVALSPDITRGHCGVPGNNYSTLLERSVDFDPFFQVVGMSYTSREQQLAALTTIQQLWDTVDPISYIHRLADPFPGQEPSAVILAPAKGDYQVSVFTNEIAARSDIGVALMENYDDEYTPWGIEPQEYGEEGYAGTAIVNWNFSNPWPEAGNTTPDDCYGDPHSLGRRRHEDHNVQMEHFWRTGRVIDVCDGDICFFPREPNPSRCPEE